MLTREAMTPANNQEKWTFGFGRVRGLVCTIAVSFGNLSFSHWLPYWKVISLNNLLISQHICIVGCYYSAIVFTHGVRMGGRRWAGGWR